MNQPLTVKQSTAKQRGGNTMSVRSGDFERECAAAMRGPVGQLMALVVPLATGAKVERATARLRSQMLVASNAIARAQLILDGEEVENDTGGS